MFTEKTFSTLKPFMNWIGVITGDLEQLLINWKVNQTVCFPDKFIVGLIDKKLTKNEKEY